MPSQFLISRRSLITAAGCGLLAYAAGPVLVPSAIPTALAEGDGQDLYFIKTANTPNGTVEVHAATATSAYQDASHHDTTLFSTDDAPNGTFHMVGQDLYFIKTANTPNGTVEVHAATATSAYQEASHHDTTLFSTDDAPNGTFHMVGQDLYFIKTANTPNGTVEVHAATATSAYQDASHHDTTLFSTDDAPNGTFHMVGQDLYFIKTANTPNGTVEVHAATATSAYQDASHHDTTLFSTDDAPNGTFHMVGQDLYFIKTANTPNGTVEVHAATATSAYQDASHHDTTLFSTDDAPNGTFHMVGQESSPEGTGDTITGGGRFNAGIVAAASQYADGSWGDQCAVFAENMIAAAGGPRIFLGNDPAGYQAAWAGWCTEQTWQTVAAGDICQWYDPSGAYSQMHTAIMTSGGSPDTATVVDSNFGTPLNQELVHRGSWSSRNVCFHEGTYKFWRVN